MDTTFRELLTITAVMVILDAGWLAYIAPTFRAMIAGIQKAPLQAVWGPAILVYVLMIIGLWWFVVRRATDWEDAAVQGAILGAVVYGVYDFTNLSTIRGWDTAVAVSDWAWGTFLFAVTAAAAKFEFN